ncbi:MAG: maleylpyruvate isomerase family mycothiol-dependent enzyme [Beutenbergiaceae bacterium]
MERWDGRELTALLDALRQTEPQAPTLCEGWQARHLVSHLYLRRHKPWLALQQGEDCEFARLAIQASEPGGYQALIEHFAAAPPAITPMALLDGPLGLRINFLEYLIHHEDLRRGSGPVPARELPPEQSDAIFDALPAFAALTMRKLRVGVVFGVPGGRRNVVKQAGGGMESVAILAHPTELALVASGRRRAADVQILGTDSAIESFTTAGF